MLCKALATIAATTMLVTAFAVPPADAKKGKKGRKIDKKRRRLRLPSTGA